MNRNYDKLLHKILGGHIRTLNEHLPAYSRTLKQLLEDERPCVATRDGSLIVMSKEELKKLCKFLSEEDYDKIRLPFTLIRRMELGRGVYTVSGSPLEKSLLCKLLGIEFPRDSELYLYKPHVRALMREIKSLIVIGFSVPKELKLLM